MMNAYRYVYVYVITYGLAVLLIPLNMNHLLNQVIDEKCHLSDFPDFNRG